MKDEIQIREVFDQRDAHEINEIVTRVAMRIHHWSEGRVSPMLLNPLALSMMQLYLKGALTTICNDQGIDMKEAPALDGEGLNTVLHLKPRN